MRQTLAEETGRMKVRQKEFSIAAAVAAGVFILFAAASPPASFLQWDDAANLLNNDKWRGLSWDHLKWMWSTRHYGPWQPLSWFSWAIDYKLWGLDPEAFRRTNVGLHAATAGLFFLACRRLLPRGSSTPLGAAGAALFFALHPLRVESVIWITERRDVLSGFFAVLAILAWLYDRRVVSAFAFVGAVLSKGTSIAVIPFLFIIDAVVLRRDARKSAVSLLPHAVIGLFAACKNLGGFQTGDLHGLNFGAVDRVLVSSSGAWFYLSKTFWPFNLSPYYALSLNGNDIRLESYPGALSALLVTGLCFHRKVRAWAVPVWFAYLIALAPVSGLLQNGRQAAADRYSYLACMPFAVAFGLALERLYLRRPRTAAAVLTGISMVLATATAVQARYWRDDISLWTRAVSIMPAAYLPNSNRSVALLAADRGEAAMPYLETSIRLEPRDAEARVNLASILAKKGEYLPAIKLFEEAVNLRPSDASFASARYNLGILLIHEGRKSDGLAQMREAVRLNPSLSRPMPR
ncbi:MAG: tetratricopeptide repeat protein [Elusimicrobia bacterium]|nr:tetratricopeptide repeat protein [Elusimicrobiota bacterium]